MDERKMILDMLKDGKITSEEAIRLLDALGDNKEKSEKKTERFFSFDIDKARESLEEVEKSVGSFISGVMNSFFDEDFSFNIRGKYENFNKRTEIDIDEEKKSLEILNRNGSVELLPTSGDKIVFESTVFHRNKDEEPESEAYFNIIGDENRVQYLVKEGEDIGKSYYVDVKVFVPIKALNSLKIVTRNAPISLQGIDLKDAYLLTKNSPIRVKQINGEKIHMESRNSRLELAQSNVDMAELISTNGQVILEDIEGKNFIVQTSNGKIRTNNIICEEIDFKTTNGPIFLYNIESENLKDVKLLSTNSPLSIELKEINKPVSLDLQTSMGDIDLQIPLALLYESNPAQSSKNIQASTEGYSSLNGLSLEMKTSNGNIKIF